MTIIEFLLDRIAEDEAGPGSERSINPAAAPSLWRDEVLVASEGGRVRTHGGDDITDQYNEWLLSQPLSSRAHRVLAECAAKRAIIEDCLRSAVGRDGDSTHHLAARTIKRLARPYADHPDYRQEWAL